MSYRISDIMFPDTCNIRPIASAGHAPGAEDASVPGTTISAVPCWVQDKRDRDILPADAKGRIWNTEVYFRDEDATREAIRNLNQNSILEITKRYGVVLTRSVNAVVNRSELDAVGMLAIWRVDCMTRS